MNSPIKKDQNRNLIQEDVQMTNKHMKRCSISYVIRELQTKTKMNTHTHEHEQHQILEKVWSNRNSHSLLVEMQNGTVILVDSLSLFMKQNILLKYDPEIILLGIGPNELKKKKTAHRYL